MWPLNCCHQVSWCNLVSSAQSFAAGVHLYRCSSLAKPPLFWPKTFSLLPKIHQAAGTIFLAPDFVNTSHRGETNSKGFAAHSQLEPLPVPGAGLRLGVPERPHRPSGLVLGWITSPWVAWACSPQRSCSRSPSTQSQNAPWSCTCSKARV